MQKIGGKKKNQEGAMPASAEKDGWSRKDRSTRWEKKKKEKERKYCP